MSDAWKLASNKNLVLLILCFSLNGLADPFFFFLWPPCDFFGPYILLSVILFTAHCLFGYLIRDIIHWSLSLLTASALDDSCFSSLCSIIFCSEPSVRLFDLVPLLWLITDVVSVGIFVTVPHHILVLTISVESLSYAQATGHVKSSVHD